jgi:hypothetical protein
MALFQDPLTAILGAIDSQNNISLVPDQYTFSNPTPFADPSGKTNTQMTITTNSVQSPYTGSVTVSYTRLDLATLATLLPLPLKFNGLSTVMDVVNAINKFFGTNFVAADIVDGPLTVGSDGSGNVTLTAQANSLGWIGTVTLPFIAGNYDLAVVIKQPVLPGLMYPERDETKPFGECYSYWRNFSAQSAQLQALVTSPLDTTTLASILATNTGSAWVDNAAARYSVQNATLVYSGPTSGAPLDSSGNPTVNPYYADVLIVQLDPTASLGYSGKLIMHYSPPGSDGIPV